VNDEERSLKIWHRLLGLPPPSRRALREVRAEKLAAVTLSLSLWAVESESVPGRFYRVWRWRAGWRCNCPAGRAQRACKHVEAVRRRAGGGECG
jgi:hypothetical protein